MNSAIHKFLTLILILCTLTVKLSAQTTGKGTITGKIIDASNNQPVPYASAILFDKKTMAKVSAAQTDLDGNFTIINIPDGVYIFKASYVGFQTMVRDSVKIAGNALSFGSIKMKTASTSQISEVTVTAPKSTMQMGIDKKVFSVDQSLVSEGGSAADLMENVPSVQTDMDGNISLRGSSGVKVLIDGKPSLIAGGNVAQILQSIPASSIESVELITNPSAKYDAEGQSGIINIVLKRNKKLGFNGSLALTAGNRDNYNGNANLSFQNKRINLFGNYSYRYGNRPGGGYNNISYLAAGFPETISKITNQNSVSSSLDKSHNIKAGLDYYLTDKDVLSFSGGLNFRDNNRNEFLNIHQLNSDQTPAELSNRNNINLGNGHSFDLNLDFLHKFKKPTEELSFSAGYSQGNNLNEQTYDTDVYYDTDINSPADPDQQNNNRGNNRNMNFQADYTVPLGNAGKVEAGLRSQLRRSESNAAAYSLSSVTNQFEPDHTLTNNFNSQEQISAAYFNYQNQIKNFGYQVGLRAEDASLDTKFGSYDAAFNLTNTSGRIAYTRLYPSVFLTQKFKNDNQLQLSYSRRVNRPRGFDTNPFLDVSDRFNYRQGNPNLKPEDVHAFELSYSKYFKNGNFSSSVYMRRTNDAIQRVRSEPDPLTNITLTTPQNLTRSTATGVELIGRIDVSKKWNFTANVNLYQNKLVGVPELGILENSGFSWNANLTNNITLPYNITLQIKGDYRAREVQAQGSRAAMYGFDGGAKYDFPNKKTSLSLNVRDIFGTRNWSMITTGQYSIANFKRYQQGTVANLTFSYRFGKTTFDLKKTKKPEQQQETRPDEENF